MNEIITRTLGLCDYQDIWERMRLFVDNRQSDTPDEIWLLEHTPVFTLGQAGLESHILNAKTIPVVRTDRGGQVTYHGPGQLVMYTLFDIERLQLGTRSFVQVLEEAIILLLQQYQLNGELREGAPGVYIDDKKIASIGLRVRKGKTYHGISLNVDMDLTPFSMINPCGYEGMQMTQLSTEKPGKYSDIWQIGCELSNLLAMKLQKTNIHLAL